MAGNISKFCISSEFLTGKLAHEILTFVFNIKIILKNLHSDIIMRQTLCAQFP